MPVTHCSLIKYWNLMTLQFSYRRGFAGVGRMEAKVVSVCLDFQAVSLISKSQSSPLKADEFEIDWKMLDARNFSNLVNSFGGFHWRNTEVFLFNLIYFTENKMPMNENDEKWWK